MIRLTKLLAGFQNLAQAMAPRQQPVSMLVYDASDPDTGPFLVDQEFFPTYNSDIEFQGVVDFANGYLVALGVNNGLMMFQVNTNFVSIPRILVQPASMTSYAARSPISPLWPTATSTMSYQWYHNGEIIPNETAATYTSPTWRPTRRASTPCASPIRTASARALPQP